MRSREEHLQWCKDRALECCDNSDPNQAVASMLSDLRKHPETADHGDIELMMSMKFSGLLNSVAETRKFIKGFN